MEKKEVKCLISEAKTCRSNMVHSMILKKSRGYCIEEYEDKTVLLSSLIEMMEAYICGSKLEVKNGEYTFCGQKVLPSKYNSLLLDSDCETIEIDNCDFCFDINDVVNRVKAICKTC